VEVLSCKVKSTVYEGIQTAESSVKCSLIMYLFTLSIKLGDHSSIKLACCHYVLRKSCVVFLVLKEGRYKWSFPPACAVRQAWLSCLMEAVPGNLLEDLVLTPQRGRRTWGTGAIPRFQAGVSNQTN